VPVAVVRGQPDVRDERRSVDGGQLECGVIPQFILMRVAGLTDTPWAMIVPGFFGGAFGTYLMRQFFRTLPIELEEAAILDGCSPWQIYWRILLPHAKPAVMVLAVLTWVNVWNDFLWPLLMIQRRSIATLTLGLVTTQGQYGSKWPVLMAASMLILLPLVSIYMRSHNAPSSAESQSRASAGDLRVMYMSSADFRTGSELQWHR
jgi:ABC-type glycerol-3-phosphate transport system permease component